MILIVIFITNYVKNCCAFCYEPNHNYYLAINSEKSARSVKK